MTKILLMIYPQLIRCGIKQLLGKEMGLQVIGDCGNVLEGLKLARELKPEIIILSLDIPESGSLEAFMRLRRIDKRMKVLVLGNKENIHLPHRLISLGAAGYITGDVDYETLLQAIGTLQKNTCYIQPDLLEQVLAPHLCLNSSRYPMADLSEREIQVFLMLARGMTQDEIADKLFLSNKTINGYRTHVLRKFRVKTNVELTRIAAHYELINLEI